MVLNIPGKNIKYANHPCCEVSPFLSLFKLSLMISKAHLYWSPLVLKCRPASANLLKLYFRIYFSSFFFFLITLREACVTLYWGMDPSVLLNVPELKASSLKTQAYSSGVLTYWRMLPLRLLKCNALFLPAFWTLSAKSITRI